MTKLSEPQVKWQSSALHALLSIEGVHGTNWIPDHEVLGAVQEVTACTSQAAHGALRALKHVGLAERSETHEGVFWKASDAALRAHKLLLGPLADELAAIYERLGGIDQGLDEALALQRLRAKLEGDEETVALIDSRLTEEPTMPERELVSRLGDCGVCGVPASTRIEVCEGYSVPRCRNHTDAPPYQAESRLADALSERSVLEATEEQLAAMADAASDIEVVVEADGAPLHTPIGPGAAREVIDVALSTLGKEADRG